MIMKNALAASLIALAGIPASAQIVFTDTGDVTFIKLFNPNGGVFAAGAYTQGDLGYFTASSNGMFSLTYLGQESAFSDGVSIIVNGQTLTESSAIGASIAGPMTASQLLDFTFFASGGDPVANGGPTVGHSTFAVLDRNVQTAYGSFEYIIGYNDSAQHDDWDDFVVGLNTLAVPEPSSWALVFGGLGVLAWVARRKGVAGAA